MEYSLNYEYDKSKIRLFFSNDSGPIYINEFINYSNWSENRLKYLDTILDKSINSLIDRCQKAIIDFKINTYDKVNTKLKMKEVIIDVVKENNEKLKDKIKMLDVSIQDWYIKKFPSDDLGKTLLPTTTFLDLNNLINSGKGEEVYTLLGGYADSVIRERCFEKLAELTEQSYDTIYNKWLNIKEHKLNECEMEK